MCTRHWMRLGFVGPGRLHSGWTSQAPLWTTPPRTAEAMPSRLTFQTTTIISSMPIAPSRPPPHSPDCCWSSPSSVPRWTVSTRSGVVWRPVSGISLPGSAPPSHASLPHSPCYRSCNSTISSLSGTFYSLCSWSSSTRYLVVLTRRILKRIKWRIEPTWLPIAFVIRSYPSWWYCYSLYAGSYHSLRVR